MSRSELGTRQLLILDAQRNRSLLGRAPLKPGFKLWVGMISPRFAPVLIYRLAYKLNSCGLPSVARIFSLFNFFFFGIEIAVICRIGPGLFLPHTHGTVIGAVSIGDNAVIYQGVTIGAKDLDFTYDSEHRPTIGNNVLIGAGAKVLGGLSLGNDVTVAANAVLLTSVGDDVTVGGIPAKVLKVRS